LILIKFQNIRANYKKIWSARFSIFFTNYMATSCAVVNLISTRLYAEARQSCACERRQQDAP